MNREEHMQWCKKRALEYVDAGDLTNAYGSMASDMGKHEETKNHVEIMLGMQLMVTGNLNTSNKMREFIEGFN